MTVRCLIDREMIGFLKKCAVIDRYANGHSGNLNRGRFDPASVVRFRRQYRCQWDPLVPLVQGEPLCQ